MSQQSKINLIDSHCHLDFEPLNKNKEAIIKRAYKAGVKKIINVGSSLKGSRASVELAEKYPHVWASVGLHPHDAEADIDLEMAIKDLNDLVESSKVVAIGEIGLDYFEVGSDVVKEKQKELFEIQLDLAIKLNLPVIIHARDAEKDILKYLTDNPSDYQVGNKQIIEGVIHCFTGSEEFTKNLLELGFYIGFTGFITFDQKKFDYIREVVKIVPLEKILVETDAPFLAPEPYRGKQNEPAYVVEVAKKIAEIKGISLEEVAKQTTKNAIELFKLK